MAKLNRLSAVQVQRSTKLGFIADGGGLYLRTRANNHKTWVFRAFIGGKPQDFLIGAVHTVPLANARQIAALARLAHLEGRDIAGAITRKDDVKTCLDAFTAIIERRCVNWKSDKTAIKWRRGLMECAKPLHRRPVTSITTKDVETILRPIWRSHNHSARGYRGMIEQALDLAKVMGWREGDNPARWKGNLEFLLDNAKPATQHHRALPYGEAPTFYRDLMASDYDTRHALAFTILTASRGHMVRHATWSEIDLNMSVWSIAAARMKKSQLAHTVPLTDAMLTLLPERRAPSELVFPYRRSGFSENAFRSTLQAMRVNATAHGFRSTFKDWALDCTAYPDEVSEIALAHSVGSSVRRAYRRGTAMDERKSLLTEWGKFLHAAV